MYSEVLKNIDEPTVILHIGGPKCGSSSLQTFLTANPLLETMQKTPVEYWKILTLPDDQKVSIFIPVLNSTNSRGIKYQVSDRLYPKLTSGCLHEIFGEFILENSLNQNKVFVFSREGWAEDFQRLNLMSCKCKIKKFKIIVFQYTRPQIEMLQSAYLQWTIWSENPTLEESSRILKTISDWELQAKNVIKSGADQIVVRYIEDIVKDFCQLLRINPLTIKNPILKRVNKSLPVEALTILLRHRELRLGEHSPFFDFLIEDYIEEMQIKMTPVHLRFDKRLIDEIQQHFHKSNLDLMARMELEHSSKYRLALIESEEKHFNGIEIDILKNGEKNSEFLESLTVGLLLDFKKFHQERDFAVQERDFAVAEREIIENSRVWRLFRFYRILRNGLTSLK